VWHANIGPLKTPQLATLHEDLQDILDSNVQDGDKAKGAIAVDGYPTSAKPPPCSRSPNCFTNAKSLSTVNSLKQETSDGRSAGWAYRGVQA